MRFEYAFALEDAIAKWFLVIIDLEYPRFGLIRIDAAEQVMLELRRLMR